MSVRNWMPSSLFSCWQMGGSNFHAAAFDMTYAWSWNEAVHKIAIDESDLDRLRVYYSWNEKSIPADIMRMKFVSNHDKNASGRGLNSSILAMRSKRRSCFQSWEKECR